MKKLYLLAASALLACSAQAVVPQNWRQVVDNATPEKVVKLKTNVKTMPLTRSAYEPETEFDATEATYYYYGDLFENGSDVFYLFLSNCGIDKGNPMAEGQIMQILLIADPAGGDAEIPALPEGKFSCADDGAAGTFYPEYTVLMDVFYDPEDPSEESLVGYIYTATEGQLNILKDGDGYSINVMFTGAMNDADGNPVDTAECTSSYSGKVEYEDIYGYTPLEGDMELDLVYASGRYLEGDFSIAFHNLPLDDEGYILGAGELLNVELFTKESSPMNLDDLVQDFTVMCDPFVTGQVPGTYMKGIWYPVWGSYYMPIGTALSIYNDKGVDTNVGLADEGSKISVTRDGDIFNFDFDIVTVEGHKVKATWSGELAKYIEDFGADDPGSVEGIIGGQSIVKGGNGCVVAPADAQVYNISGVRTAHNGLTPGLYIVRHNGKATKVVVK